MSKKILTMERVFAAPRNLVWRAWTEPALFAQWYGPKGCEVTFAQFEPHPGGVARHAMDFGKGAMHGKFEFVEFEEPERLVFRQMMCDADGNPMRNPQMAWPLALLSTITLEEHAEGTLMRFEWAPIDATEEEMASFMMAVEKNQSGWGMGFDNLRELVEGEPPTADWLMAGFLHAENDGERDVVLTRDFAAPPDLVYRAFTEPELVEKWMVGSDGWSLSCQMEVRPGGKGRYEWRGPDGEVMVANVEFDEVEEGKRTVHRELFEEDWTGGEAIVDTSFLPFEDGTRVLLRITYATAEARANVTGSGAFWFMEAGYQNLDEVLST